MNDFMHQQPGQIPPAFAMEQMRRDLPAYHTPVQRTPSPGWSAEFDTGEQARMEAAFTSSKMGQPKHQHFNSADFANFQQRSHVQRAETPITHSPPLMSGYQRPMGMGYGGMGMGMGMQMYGGGMHMQQEPQNMQDVKGKSRMVELDDSNWEEQFKELEISKDQDTLSDEANQAMEAELDDLDRLADSETHHGITV